MSKITLAATNAPASVQHVQMNDRLTERNSHVPIPSLGSINDVRAELDAIFEDIKRMHEQEPDEVMVVCSARSARLSELRMLIYRVEDLLSYWKPIRTHEVDPAMEELRFQFNLASRLLTQRQLDWDMTRGS